MLLYIIQYGFVILFSSITAFSKKYERVAGAVVFFLLFLLAGFRGRYVGRDYTVYEKYFSMFVYSNKYTIDYLDFFEPAFYFIPTISYFLFGKMFLLGCFAIFALLGVYLKLKAILQFSNSFFLSIVIYAGGLFYLHEMTQIRAGVASGILLLSMKPIRDRNFPRFLLYMLSACFFHYSSLLFLPIYFLNHKKFNIKLYSIILLSALTIAILKINLLQISSSIPFAMKLEMYAQRGRTSELNIFNYGFLISFIMLLLLILRQKIIQQYNPYFLVMLNIFFFSIVFYLVAHPIPVLAIRTYELLGSVQFCIVPCVIYMFDKRWIGYAIAAAYGIAGFYIYIYHTSIMNAYTPYWSNDYSRFIAI